MWIGCGVCELTVYYDSGVGLVLAECVGAYYSEFFVALFERFVVVMIVICW